jgi:two-component system, OmpR family, catabolic regulation response regulator CreB
LFLLALILHQPVGLFTGNKLRAKSIPMSLSDCQITNNQPAQHILVVEDDPAIAQTVQFALEQSGYLTHWVTLGKDAVDKLITKPNLPSLKPIVFVILDVGLPDLSGFEVCRRIRSFSQVPVLFLTAHADEIDRVLGFETGADDYLVKPFSPRELVARVRAILRRQGATQAPQASAFTHDEVRACIHFQGEALNLTKTEYKILRQMVASPERVFTRDQLLDLAMGTSSPSGDRAIDTHIKQIRAKIAELHTEEEYIITHRGLGYSLKLLK